MNSQQFQNRESLQGCNEDHFDWAAVRLQEEVPRFALENLGCSGTEARLVDCPPHTSNEVPEDDPDYDFFAAQEMRCNPYSNTFAVIACGDTGAAGVHCDKYK